MHWFTYNLVPTGLNGPLPFKCHALLLGRSSSSKSGLSILPGIINSDAKGETKIIASTPNPPCTIHQDHALVNSSHFLYCQIQNQYHLSMLTGAWEVLGAQALLTFTGLNFFQCNNLF